MKWLNLLLLLFCFNNYSGTSPAPVTGKKGGNVTLSCESAAREISAVDLRRLTKKILVCEKQKCKSENDRVFKEGSCDVIINDLRFSDAGKYILYVYYKNAQAEVERQIDEYHLHIHDEISVKKGEDLKLDVLLSNADKVEHQNRISSDWENIWTRGHGVNSDRLTDRDGNLTINRLTVNDTGTYRVLDPEGEILIMITVTESGTDSKGKLDTDDDHKPNEQHKIWIIVCVCGALLVLLAGITVAVMKKHQNRNTEPNPQYHVVPMQENGSPEHLVTSLSTCNLPSE